MNMIRIYIVTWRMQLRKRKKYSFWNGFISSEKYFRNFVTFIHILKSMIGTGIFAMPKSFYRAGWLLGIVGSAVIGIMLTYCLHNLVSRFISQMFYSHFISVLFCCTGTEHESLMQTSPNTGFDLWVDNKTGFGRWSTFLSPFCTILIVIFSYYWIILQFHWFWL